MYKKLILYELLDSPQTLDEDTDLCHICMDLLIQPIQCKHCKSKFCKICADKWNKGKHKCPNKCTEKWDYIRIQTIKKKLMCPFCCKTKIYPEDFMTHIRECQNTPQQYKSQFSEEEMKLKYRCKKNHPLLFMENIENISQLDCVICQRNILSCRNICVTCETNGQQQYGYCCNCRLPKGISKINCPVGHTDLHVKASSSVPTTLCDICSHVLKDNGAAYISDEICMLNICSRCFQQLQDGYDIALQKLNSSRSNTPTQSPQLSRSSSQYSSKQSNNEKHCKN